MAALFISVNFYQAPDTVYLGNRIVGIWLRMASYHAGWLGYDIHPTIAKKCGARAADIDKLVEVGWLVVGEKGWRIGQSDNDLWKFGTTADGRVARPAIPADVRAAVFKRDGLACLRCESVDDLTLDHIIPWSLGGPDTVENLRVLCRRCNSARGNRVEVDA